MNNIRRLFTILYIILFILSCDKTTTSSEPVVVTFPDANFEALIRETLNKPTGEIFNTDLVAIKKLAGKDHDISIIKGIEYCTNLDTLDLALNNIEDISFLSSLVQIKSLNINFNNITDISVLSGLTNLNLLRLIGNGISDINSLSSLINLDILYLSFNQISDISSLSGLTKLRILTCSYNLISDLNSLSSLNNLLVLFIDNNNIIDIGSLVNNNGIDNGDSVYLENNPLSATSINTYIPQLEARGVTVHQ